MTNEIAVILSVYRRDKLVFLKQAVDSILMQSHKNKHLFVGVDGPVSEDIRSYLLELSRQDGVTVYWYDTNRGLACVLNDLLTNCMNKGYCYIARMDADDISVIDRLQKQYLYLQENSDIDVVGGAIQRIDENGMFIGDIKNYPESHNSCYKRFAKRNPLSHPAVLFRKSFFDKAGTLYRPEYKTNQDTLLWHDGLLKGVKMSNIPDLVLYFRVTDEMLTKRRGGVAKAKKQLEDRLMINKHLKYGFGANVYAVGVFVYMILPLPIKKIMYNILK